MVTTHLADDGTVRQNHYGQGRQPWDDMVSFGWDVHFAVASILKYLRRDKEQAWSISSARWYHDRLQEIAAYQGWNLRKLWRRHRSERALRRLVAILTDDELYTLLGED